MLSIHIKFAKYSTSFVITWDPNYRFDEIVEDEEEEEAVASDDENETNDAEVEPDFNNDTDELRKIFEFKSCSYRPPTYINIS